MDAKAIRKLLESVSRGRLTVDQALDQLKRLPFEDLSYACVDHHRSLRKGFPEVIFGEGKSVEQIQGVMEAMVDQQDTVMITRVSAEKAKAIMAKYPKATYHPEAHMLVLASKPIEPASTGLIMVIAAGTSDIPVAEEAQVTARTMGHRVESLYDVGVSGIHRLMRHDKLWTEASVFIVVAGMEGALPSVVGGLVDKPVIAVPTSIGYGSSFGGITALLGMLNSCASNVTVVNIDNGFGAGYVAATINALANSS
ncbi:MAG: nickel pincer cofactor biosynthesis protein LarB [Desulfobacterales bacterium]|nr:MAG: nickel pincer cofactor biosynthesis protein LarB [Desulfobacterales bacterium]